MNVGTAWWVYILVVIIAFIIFWLLFRGLSGGWCNKYVWLNALFFALLIGAIAVFFIGQSIILKTSSDRTWFSVLLIVAYLLPLILLLVCLFQGGWWEMMAKDECQTSTDVVCDPSGCQTKKITSKCGNDKVKVYFN